LAWRFLNHELPKVKHGAVKNNEIGRRRQKYIEVALYITLHCTRIGPRGMYDNRCWKSNDNFIGTSMDDEH